MSIETEGAPREVMSEVSNDVHALAERARNELLNIELSGSDEFKTASTTDLKTWIKNKALSEPDSIAKFQNALKISGFIGENEKFFIEEKIADVVNLFDDFISNPEEFKVKNPSNLKLLIGLSEALMQE